MKNRYIKKIFTATLFAGVLMSCDSQLDIKPEQSIEQELALSSSQNVQAILVGAYDLMGDNDLFGGSFLRNAELLASNDELLWQGTYQGPREIFNKAISIENADVSLAWTESYQAINAANNVLAAISIVDEAQKNSVEGESLFIRASLYFELVKFFAKPYAAGNTSSNLGVPLVLTPTLDITQITSGSLNLPRNTVEECYQQIVSDLQRAASLLPSNTFFAGREAANAMLSRVYLQMGNYQGARDAANAVISSGNFSLMNNYADAFNTGFNTNEDIFAMQVTAQDGVNDMVTFFLSQTGGGRGDIPALQSHLDLYEAGDARLDFFFFEDGDYWTGKWTELNDNNVKVLRLAEMYLTRAEANFRLGTTTGATPLADVNMIRNRVGLESLTSVTLNDILKERKLELAFEGHSIHEVKRLQGSVDGFAYDADELVFPIPQREMLANPNMVQNPGY